MYSKKFLTTNVVKSSQKLPETHSKVTTFQRIFNAIFRRLPKNEKTKSDVHEFTLDFDVQANPIHYEINYYKKRMDNRGRQHVLYVLEIDFESKERIEVPKEVQGGEFYGSDSDDETDSYVDPGDNGDDDDMDDGDNTDEFHSPARE